jgi:beta-lactamase regulating signal transducer with metallopeptidase domain
VETLLRIALSNALAAGGLALAAGVVGRFCRRPALVHSLWLLVLLKLLTPPLVTVPLPWPAAPEPTRYPAPAHETLMRGGTDEPLPAEGDEELPVALLEVLHDPAPAASEAPPVAAVTGWPVLPWTALLPALWAAGTAGWVGLAVWRLWHFARLLRFARPAPRGLRKQARDIAARLGLERCPPVVLVPGQISPMLWALAGQARLLLPADLLDRLSREQQATLLAHELAHLRRRDHWVRRLEFVVCALYWWHPAVWWACRELREAEEQCCDAWVVWALPGIGRAYALTLVETVDFLSEARAALPALASGVGHVDNLRRRVTMIMRGATPRALTWGGCLVVFGLAAFLLPLLPTWAHSDPADDEKPVRAGDGRVEVQVRDELRRGEQDKDRADIKKLEAEVAEMRKRLQEAEERLKRAHAHMADTTGHDGHKKMILIIEGPNGVERRIEIPDGAGSAGPRGEGRVFIREEKVDGGKMEIRRPEGGDMRGRIIINPREGDGRPGMQPGAGGPPPGVPGGGRSPADLERKLDEIIREIDELRRELKRQPGPGGFGGPGVPGRPGGDDNRRFTPLNPPQPSQPPQPSGAARPPAPPVPVTPAVPPPPPRESEERPSDTLPR